MPCFKAAGSEVRPYVVLHGTHTPAKVQGHVCLCCGGRHLPACAQRELAQDQPGESCGLAGTPRPTIRKLICCQLDHNMCRCWHKAPRMHDRGEAGKLRCSICRIMLPDFGCSALPGGCCTGSYSWGGTSAADHMGGHQWSGTRAASFEAVCGTCHPDLPTQRHHALILCRCCW